MSADNNDDINIPPVISGQSYYRQMSRELCANDSFCKFFYSFITERLRFIRK